MIATLEVVYKNAGLSLAFRSQEDAKRFIVFVEQHERECPDADRETSYRLDPQWSLGQYNHVPKYCTWHIDPNAVLRMIMDLLDARERTPQFPACIPKLDLHGSKEDGISFELTEMIPAPLLN